jgi:hypothetical protein
VRDCGSKIVLDLGKRNDRTAFHEARSRRINSSWVTGLLLPDR